MFDKPLFHYTINHYFTTVAKSMAEAVRHFAQHHPGQQVNDVLVVSV